MLCSARFASISLSTGLMVVRCTFVLPISTFFNLTGSLIETYSSAWWAKIYRKALRRIDAIEYDIAEGFSSKEGND